MLEDEPDIKIVGEASNGLEAVTLAQKLHPKVIVMDYAMPEMDGLQATLEIRRHTPGCAILILSMHSDAHYIRNALDAGARGYMLKNAIDVDLVTAVKALAEGRSFGITQAPADDDENFGKLTQREKQILQLIAQGNSNKEIAGLLNLSVNTISVHRANLMEALNIHRTAELVLYAIRKGLVTPP
jgi:DNA-binding NarL/FixJ family response regulator